MGNPTLEALGANNSELAGLRDYLAMVNSNAYKREQYNQNLKEASQFGYDEASGMTLANYLEQNVPAPKYSNTEKLNLNLGNAGGVNIQDMYMQGNLDGQGNASGDGRLNLQLNPGSKLFPTLETSTDVSRLKQGIQAKTNLNSLSNGFIPKGYKLKVGSDIGLGFKDENTSYDITGGTGGFKANYKRDF